MKPFTNTMLMGNLKLGPAHFIQDINYLGQNANLVRVLDAGDLDSYPGTGITWFDVSGNSADMTISGSAPFIGTPGEVSDDVYFSGDTVVGTVHFSGVSTPAVIGNLHKNNAQFTIAVVAQKVDPIVLFSTYKTSTGGITFGSSTGLGTNLLFDVQKDGGNDTLRLSHSAPLVNSEWFFAAISIDDIANTVRFMNNNVIDVGSVGYSNPGSVSATDFDQIGRFQTTARFNDAKIARFGLWNRALSSTELTELYERQKLVFTTLP